MTARQVKHKATPFGLIQYDGDGIIEGFPAIFGNVDADGDVILPGAFARTIKGAGRKAILGLDHEHGLGTTLELAEVTRNDLPREILAAAPDATGGLWARGQVMLTPENIVHLETMSRMTDAGNAPGMSFTYATIAERKARSRFGREVNELVELQLDEWGPDLRKKPRNAAARLTRAKAGAIDDVADEVDEAAAKAVAESYGDVTASDVDTEAALVAYVNRAAARLAGAAPADAKAGAVLASVNLSDLDAAIEALQRIRARAVKDTGDAPGQGTDAPASTAKATADSPDDLASLDWDLSLLSTEAALLAVA